MILGTPLQNELGMHFCASKGFQKAGILNICIDMWAPISIFVPVKGLKSRYTGYGGIWDPNGPNISPTYTHPSPVFSRLFCKDQGAVHGGYLMQIAATSASNVSRELKVSGIFGPLNMYHIYLYCK